MLMDRCSRLTPTEGRLEWNAGKETSMPISYLIQVAIFADLMALWVVLWCLALALLAWRTRYTSIYRYTSPVKAPSEAKRT
jgi:hypothetical protein